MSIGKVKWDWRREGTPRSDVALMRRSVVDAKDVETITCPMLDARVFAHEMGGNGPYLARKGHSAGYCGQ